MTDRPGYFEEFLDFWSSRNEVTKIWFSLFTPQKGAEGEEILTFQQRDEVLTELVRLRDAFPKMELPDSVVKGYMKPPQTPNECIFSRTTLNITADLQGMITPCQFGGDPDCSRCGCMASAGIQAVGDHRVFGVVPIKSLFFISDKIGKQARRLGAGERWRLASTFTRSHALARRRAPGTLRHYLHSRPNKPAQPLSRQHQRSPMRLAQPSKCSHFDSDRSGLLCLSPGARQETINHDEMGISVKGWQLTLADVQPEHSLVAVFVGNQVFIVVRHQARGWRHAWRGFRLLIEPVGSLSDRLTYKYAV